MKLQHALLSLLILSGPAACRKEGAAAKKLKELNLKSVIPGNEKKRKP